MNQAWIARGFTDLQRKNRVIPCLKGQMRFLRIAFALLLNSTQLRFNLFNGRDSSLHLFGIELFKVIFRNAYGLAA